ncbi:hypothetical protein EV199_4301 [Pseudobacter ginsenosidimutans]|uniref:Uncharacterized protein n=2 Tax=Pseudobacter ginsenosidimutans TaxID=661488 RepID=A0A4Q7MU29_9BACT|nr:hypothetical protein EV199_4301 [Pseudobacter ginsenosidimutans]
MIMFITIPVNVFLLGGALFVAFLIGYMIRSKDLAKSNKKVTSLETEMVSNHAEILNLQKENVELEKKLKSLSIPVIPMTKEDKEAKRVASQSPTAQKHS